MNWDPKLPIIPGRYGAALARFVQRFPVQGLRTLRDHGQARSAWRAEGAPLELWGAVCHGRG